MKNLSLWNKIIKIIIPLYAVYAIYMEVKNGMNDRIMATAALFLVILVPFLVRKILRYDISHLVEFIYLVFILLAHLLGSVVNLYARIWWWDLFVHCLSGVLTAILGLLILKRMSIDFDKNKWLVIVFSICFSLAVASCWEFFEFTVDKITGGDTQWVLLTGVDDTMTDMLIAFLGTILFNIYFLIAKKKKWKSLEVLEKEL